MLRHIPKVLVIQSHVVHGHAGNSAAIFPMGRLGVKALPLNTVQYSNHTQYQEKWTGMVMPPGHITSIVDGLENINILQSVDGILSGFLGSEAQAEEVLEVVQRIKKINPNAKYLCDPVMGTPEKGCIVPAGVTDFIAKHITSKSDYLCPNQLEVNTFLHRKPISFQDCVSMARELYEQNQQGPTKCKALLVKHLYYPEKDKDSFEMLLVCNQDREQNETKDVQIYHIKRPLFPFSQSPVGVGDLTSAIFFSKILTGMNLVDAFEFTTSSVHRVMEETSARNSYELEIIASQDKIVDPKYPITSTLLKL